MKLSPKTQMLIYIIILFIMIIACLIYAGVMYNDVTCALTKCIKVK